MILVIITAPTIKMNSCRAQSAIKSPVRHKSSKQKRSNQSIAQGELRIIGGQWKRTKLTFPLLEGVRPTPSRVRETLFNWLQQDIANARCLDLFAGSGALGFEALSRGAEHVQFVDSSAEICRTIKANVSRLYAEANAEVHQADALMFAHKAQPKPVDIVFCDPPFNKGLVPELLKHLEDSNIIADDGLIYVETEAALKDLSAPQEWQCLKEKKAGDVIYRLYQI